MVLPRLVLSLAVIGCSAAFAPRSPRRPVRSAPARSTAEGDSGLRPFLDELPSLGALRFITVGPSAILETVASAEAVNYKDLGDGATMATLKTTDARFEAHLRLHELAAVRMETKPKGDATLHFIKFLSKLDGDASLMCLLHKPDADAVRRWEQLRDKYGEEQRVA